LASGLREERLEAGVRRSILPGGGAVISERVDAVRSVALGVWIRQGAALEARGEGGISHLLEHAVFKGTRARTTREIAATVEAVGGSLDAFTSHEYTVFQVHVPAVHLERALDVVCDLISEPSLRREDVLLERGVVLDEIAMVEDTPEERVFDLHAAYLYGDHPYGFPVLGTEETVRALDEGALRRLHRRSYALGSAVIAAAGCVDHGELVDLIAGRISDSEEPTTRDAVPPVTRGRTGFARVPRATGNQSHIVAGGLGVCASDPVRHAVALVGTAVGGGMSSRLFQRIREELGLAYSVYSFEVFFEAAGHAGAYLATQPNSAAVATEALLHELREVAERGLRPAEVETTREQLKGQILLSLEAPVARMSRLAALTLHGESYRSADELIARVDAITSEQIAEAAALLHPDRLAVLELSPDQDSPAESFHNVGSRTTSAPDAPATVRKELSR